MTLEETCLHRFLKDLKDCRGCLKDTDTSHHPNNYDCRSYYSIRIMTHQVAEEICTSYEGNKK